MQDRKSELLSTAHLAKLILVLISGLLLLTIISLITSNETDIESAIITCRASIEAREFTADHTKGTARSAVPMLCKTIDIEIPEDRYDELARHNFTKAVMMNIADRAMDCWYMFGEGTFDKNVFGTIKGFGKNRCFTCFTFTIKDERRYDYEPVNPNQFEDFFLEEPYRPIPRNVPFCLHDQDEESGRCVPRDASECQRKGGLCFDKKDNIQAYVRYDGWSCDSTKKVCYVYEDMVQSYFEYMWSKAPGLFTQGPPLYSFNHEDLIIEGVDHQETLPMYSEEHLENKDFSHLELSFSNLNIEGFNKDQIYGIAFISDTTAWGWTVVSGVAVGLTTGISVLLAKFTGGVSLIIGAKTIAMITGAGAGVGAGYLTSLAYDKLTGNEPIIYISTLPDLEENCNVREDFNQ